MTSFFLKKGNNTELNQSYSYEQKYPKKKKYVNDTSMRLPTKNL